jgi:hypothetical protein
MVFPSLSSTTSSAPIHRGDLSEEPVVVFVLAVDVGEQQGDGVGPVAVDDSFAGHSGAGTG